MEPAVAKVAEDLKGEAVAGCLGEEVEVASYPLEVAADLQQKHIRLGVLWGFFSNTADAQTLLLCLTSSILESLYNKTHFKAT